MKRKGRVISISVFALTVIALGSYYSFNENPKSHQQELMKKQVVSKQETRSLNIAPETVGSIEKFDREKEDFESLLGDVDFITIDVANDIPPSNLLSVYDQLVSQAELGDVGAARQLAIELWDCNYSHSSRAELDAALKRIENEKIVSFPDPEGDAEWEVDISAESFEAVSEQVSNLTDSFERCRGIDAPKRALSEVKKWAQIAAEQGDSQSIKFLQMRARKNPEEAVKWLNEAWEQLGDVDALKDIALYHARGLDESRTPDYEKAYIYNHAYNLIKSASLERLESEYSYRTVNDFFLSVDSRSAKYESQLGANETIEAERLARDLIKDNQNCCSSIRWW